MDLIYCTKTTNIPTLYQILEKNRSNITLLIRLIFYLRDCRGGKGLRKIGRFGFLWLFLNCTENFIKYIHLIPQYGRWDDLFIFFPYFLKLEDLNFVNNNYSCNLKELERVKYYQKQIVFMIVKQLKQDLKSKDENCSLLAKWIPTENSRRDKEFQVIKTLCQYMKISRKTLRKTYITPIRTKLHILEKYLHFNNWRCLPYDKMCKGSIKRYQKAFLKWDKERFQNYKSKFKNLDENLHKNSIVFFDFTGVEETLHVTITITLLSDIKKILSSNNIIEPQSLEKQSIVNILKSVSWNPVIDTFKIINLAKTLKAKKLLIISSKQLFLESMNDLDIIIWNPVTEGMTNKQKNITFVYGNSKETINSILTNNILDFSERLNIIANTPRYTLFQ